MLSKECSDNFPWCISSIYDQLKWISYLVVKKWPKEEKKKKKKKKRTDRNLGDKLSDYFRKEPQNKLKTDI